MYSGRDDLLLEYYVSELLGVVKQNASHEKEKTNLCLLYDKLEPQFRALVFICMTRNK
jgi:hypothetical protein